jgi:hypothetical protein
VDVRRGLGGRRVGFERPPAGQELERDDPERVEVARRRRALAARLLRREVAGGAEDRAGLRERVEACRARDPEVGDLDVATLVEEQVARLDVAVHDPRRVRRVERSRGVREPRERPARLGRPSIRDQVLERPAADVLHDDERARVVLADVEDRDDVRVARQPCRGERLALEPLPERLVARVRLGQHLQRDAPAELGVGDEVDLAHAARSDPLGIAVTGRKSAFGSAHRSDDGARGRRAEALPHRAGQKRS